MFPDMAEKGAVGHPVGAWLKQLHGVLKGRGVGGGGHRRFLEAQSEGSEGV